VFHPALFVLLTRMSPTADCETDIEQVGDGRSETSSGFDRFLLRPALDFNLL